jgi:PAS domain S-box-containing protein
MPSARDQDDEQGAGAAWHYASAASGLHMGERVLALQRYGIMDTAQDPAFDRITALAADLMDVPIALICFLDDTRLWVKSSVGSDLVELPLAASVCQATLRSTGTDAARVWIVPDTHLDPQSAARHAAGADPSLRFYGAAPLTTPDGITIGALCVLDKIPRADLPPGGAERLQTLAALVMDLLERKRERDEQQRDKAEIALIRDIHSVLTEKNLSFAATLDRILHRLLHAFGAYACRVWERRENEAFVSLVSLVCVDPIDAGHHEDLGARKVRLSDLVASCLFEAENATMWRLTDPVDMNHPRLGPAVAAGIGGLAGCSLTLGDRSFAVVMTFKGAKTGLADHAAMLGRVGMAVRPILQRKLADERTALFSTALETTQDGVMIAEITDDDDHYHRIVFVNAALMAQTGYRADELLGRSLSVLNVPDADIVEINRIKAAMRRGEPVRTMLRRRRRDGSSFWAETTLVPLMDADGHATHRLGIMRDMTQQRAEAEDLRERERALLATTRKLETLTGQLIRTQEIAKLGTWRRRIDSDQIEWSDSIYAMFGVSKDSFTPTPSSVLARVHPDDRQSIHSRVVFARADAIVHSVTYRIVADDGVVRTLSSDCTCETAADGTVIALSGIIQDVTDQKHAQAMLLQAEKLRSIGQLTGGIAHDFNNLLTVVSVNLEMLGDMIGPDHPGEELRAMALRAAEGGATLTANLLAFARRQSLQPANCNVNTLLFGLKEMAQHSIGERHPIVLSIDPNLPPCLLDRSGFESAMLNLLVNSRDAMPDGGTISITTELHHVGSSSKGRMPASIGAGAYVAVSVSDNGQGIPPELLERVFEPFFTTKPFGKGTGLGLSTVIGFVRQSGGDVELTSRLQLGTDVTLYFPVPASAVATKTSGLTAVASAPRGQTPGRLASSPVD